MALPLPREAPGDAELRAAQVSALAGLPSSAPGEPAPPTASGASAMDATAREPAGPPELAAPERLGASAAARDTVPNDLLPASRVAVQGAEVAALSGAVGPAELKWVELMLQYTGRSTAVVVAD